MAVARYRKAAARSAFCCPVSARFDAYPLSVSACADAGYPLPPLLLRSVLKEENGYNFMTEPWQVRKEYDDL